MHGDGDVDRGEAAFVARVRAMRSKMADKAGDANTWVLTREDYDELIHRRPAVREHLRTVNRAETLLFVGYGLQDSDLEFLVSEMRAFADRAPTAALYADASRPGRPESPSPRSRRGRHHDPRVRPRGRPRRPPRPPT